MTGREKIEAALSTDGSGEIAAVIPYEDILIRDHWAELTSCPWWFSASSDLVQQLCWRRDAARRIGQDWITLSGFYSHDEREHLRIEERPSGVFMVDDRAGTERMLSKPRVSGWSESSEPPSLHVEAPADSFEEIDRLVPDPEPLRAKDLRESGRCDLAHAMLADFGSEMFPLARVNSPLWNCYGLWGFEGMMTMVAANPGLVKYACERYLAHAARAVREAAALGAAGVWIEECMTDMISPRDFAALNVPSVSVLVEEIRSAGLKSIYYYCGNPKRKWDLLMSTGADALALEEGKKGFEIDIAEAAERADGRCALMGNLDAVGILQNGDEDALRAEIARQIEAGRRNKGRFIMCLGSPVTPSTPIDKVSLFCRLTRELGRL